MWMYTKIFGQSPGKISIKNTNWKYFDLIQAKDAIIRNDIHFITKVYSRIKYVVDKVFFVFNSFFFCLLCWENLPRGFAIHFFR